MSKITIVNRDSLYSVLGALEGLVMQTFNGETVMLEEYDYVITALKSLFGELKVVDEPLDEVVGEIIGYLEDLEYDYEAGRYVHQIEEVLDDDEDDFGTPDDYDEEEDEDETD